jgi:hypothetical protein
MGYATATITIERYFSFGHKVASVVKVSCSSYDTSGIQIAAADCGLNVLDYLIPGFQGIGSVNNDPVSVWWDSTNGVLLCYKSSASQSNAATNIATAGYIYCLAIGL